MNRHPFITDLLFAMQADLAVNITLNSGLTILSGVLEIDQEFGIVTLPDPQTFGDTTTTRKVYIGQIASLSVTDIAA